MTRAHAHARGLWIVTAYTVRRTLRTLRTLRTVYDLSPFLPPSKGLPRLRGVALLFLLQNEVGRASGSPQPWRGRRLNRPFFEAASSASIAVSRKHDSFAAIVLREVNPIKRGLSL